MTSLYQESFLCKAFKRGIDTIGPLQHLYLTRHGNKQHPEQQISFCTKHCCQGRMLTSCQKAVL